MELGVCDEKKGLLEEYMRKSSPPPFLMKTYMLVEDAGTDEVVSWNGEGTGFVVWKPAEFARDLLPTLFKHSNFSSFVRQLNTYGFRKVTTNRWEFCNEKFRRGEKDQLCKIRRRKAWTNNKNQSAALALAEAETQAQAQAEAEPAQLIAAPATATRLETLDDDQRSSSMSSSSELSSLVDENKRLKKENGALSSELSSMKSKCRELLELVAKYAHCEKEERDVRGGDDRRPMLFGVRLEAQGEIEKKRKRAEVSQTARVFLSQACK